MKYNLILLAVTFISVSFGQKTVQAKFTTGEVKEVQYFDDPFNLPDFEVGINPFCITAMPGVMFGYKIAPRYRLNQKISFDGHYISVYADDMNAMSGRYEFSTGTFDLSIMGHYTFSNKTKTENKFIPIDYDNTSQANPDADVTIYKVELPIVKNTAYRVDGGFGKIATNSLFDGSEEIVLSSNETETIRYNGGAMFSNSLQIGASLFKSRSYKVITDSKKYSYFRTATFYSYLTYSIANKYTIYQTESTLQPDEEYTFSHTDVTSSFTDLKDSKLGFRIGFDLSAGMRNTGVSFLFGLVAGMTPTYTSMGVGYQANDKMDHKSGSKVSGNGYFGFNVGFAFGNSPWKN